MKRYDDWGFLADDGVFVSHAEHVAMLSDMTAERDANRRLLNEAHKKIASLEKQAALAKELTEGVQRALAAIYRGNGIDAQSAMYQLDAMLHKHKAKESANGKA